MRIGYYIPGWPPGLVPNGIVTMLGHLCGNLNEDGHEIFFIAPSSMIGVEGCGVTILDPFDFRAIPCRLRFKWDAIGRSLFKSNAMSTFNRAAANRIAVAVE